MYANPAYIADCLVGESADGTGDNVRGGRARQQPAATLPVVDPAVADAVWRQRTSHDMQAITAALRQLLAGLILLQREGTAQADAIDSLIAALVPPAMAGQGLADPVAVERMRAWAFGVAPPDAPLRAPLPVI